MKKAVIIIDNQESDISVIEYTAHQWGYQSVVARDKSQARKILDGEQFEVIFTNVSYKDIVERTEQKIIGISDLETENILQIIRLNPYDLLVRPVKSAEVSIVLSKANSHYADAPCFPSRLVNIYNFLKSFQNKV